MTDVQLYNAVRTFHDWCVAKSTGSGPLRSITYRQAAEEGIRELHQAALKEQKAKAAETKESEGESQLGGS